MNRLKKRDVFSITSWKKTIPGYVPQQLLQQTSDTDLNKCM